MATATAKKVEIWWISKQLSQSGVIFIYKWKSPNPNGQSNKKINCFSNSSNSILRLSFPFLFRCFCSGIKCFIRSSVSLSVCVRRVRFFPSRQQASASVRVIKLVLSCGDPLEIENKRKPIKMSTMTGKKTRFALNWGAKCCVHLSIVASLNGRATQKKIAEYMVCWMFGSSKSEARATHNQFFALFLAPRPQHMPMTKNTSNNNNNRNSTTKLRLSDYILQTENDTATRQLLL